MAAIGRQAIAVEAGVIDAAAPEANVVARVETTGATIKFLTFNVLFE
jgi:hypothetical protein